MFGGEVRGALGEGVVGSDDFEGFGVSGGSDVVMLVWFQVIGGVWIVSAEGMWWMGKFDIPCLRDADVVERLVLVSKPRETNTDDHLGDCCINLRE